MPEYEIFDLGQLATLQRLLDRHGLPSGGHVHVRPRDGRAGRHAGHHAGAGRLRLHARLPAGRDVLGHRHRPHHASRSCSPRCPPAGTCGSAWRTRSPTPRASRCETTPSWSPAPPASPGSPSGRRSPRPRPASAARDHGARVTALTRAATARRGGPVRVRGERARRHRSVVLAPTGRCWPRPATPDAPIFPRSANKPMQAVGMLRAGLAADRRRTCAVCGQLTRASRCTSTGCATARRRRRPAEPRWPARRRCRCDEAARRRGAAGRRRSRAGSP